MKTTKTILTLLVASIFVYGCSKDDSKDNPPIDTGYNFVNNGNGAVTTINDTDDDSSLTVVQAIPVQIDAPQKPALHPARNIPGLHNRPSGASQKPAQVVDYPKTIPVILFFDDKIYLESLKNGFEVTQNGEVIGGNVYINEAANGYAILTFTPHQVFAPGTSISVNLSGVQDDGGNQLEGSAYSLKFAVSDQSQGSFDGNGGFSTGEGVLFIGDGSVMDEGQSCVAQGSTYAAITSGGELVSSNSAIGNASSIMILGTINEDISSLTFDYNFLSAEFNEYVGSIFDDSVILTVVGPNNAYTEFLTSVNTVGANANTECGSFPGMPDNGDDYFGTTGWINKTVNFSNVGSPAYAIFTITDVSDQILSSVLAVDNVSY